MLRSHPELINTPLLHCPIFEPEFFMSGTWQCIVFDSYEILFE